MYTKNTQSRRVLVRVWDEGRWGDVVSGWQASLRWWARFWVENEGEGHSKAVPPNCVLKGMHVENFAAIKTQWDGFFDSTFVYLVYVERHSMVRMQRSEDSWQELAHSFYHRLLKGWTQIVWLDSKHLYSWAIMLYNLLISDKSHLILDFIYLHIWLSWYKIEERDSDPFNY